MPRWPLEDDERLGLERIDLYQLHRPDRSTPIDETLRALDDVVRSGKARYVGFSNLPAWLASKALTFAAANHLTRFQSAQVYYSIAGRDIEREIAPCFVERDGRRTDQIVLACTHFPLIADKIKRLSPWPVGFVDPAPAIARRLDALGADLAHAGHGGRRDGGKGAHEQQRDLRQVAGAEPQNQEHQIR